MAWARALYLGLTTVALLGAAPTPVRGHGAVSSDHELASEAGAWVLSRGGNAVDAAVATALAAGVVQPAGSGLGGGGFAVFTDGDVVRTLDFREMAPAASHPTMFLDATGAPVADASRVGGLAAALPGEPTGLAELVSRHGQLPHRVVARPAVRLARRGFPMGAHLAGALDRSRHADVRAAFPEPFRAGTPVRRPALAKALVRWGRTEGASLRDGRDARALTEAVLARGGAWADGETSTYVTRDRAPLSVRWGDFTVVSMAPPSSGGVVLCQALRALDGLDLGALGHNSSAYVHVVAEALKHGYADRARFLADPDFVDVPVEALLSDDRVAAVRAAFDPERTLPADAYGLPAALPDDGGTQHISVIDADGRAVALTTTINTSFGSGVYDPSTGIILNDEMDDFVIAPGVPNAYGLVGDEDNAPEPGKRPLSSTTPTLVFDAEGDVVLAVGASGGATIISSVLQVLLGVLVFDLDPQEAVAAPRFHHQWTPDVLWLEPGFPADVRSALESRGHRLRIDDAYSAVQVVRRDGDQVTAGADPRKDGQAAGVW